MNNTTADWLHDNAHHAHINKDGNYQWTIHNVYTDEQHRKVIISEAEHLEDYTIKCISRDKTQTQLFHDAESIQEIIDTWFACAIQNNGATALPGVCTHHEWHGYMPCGC